MVLFFHELYFWSYWHYSVHNTHSNFLLTTLHWYRCSRVIRQKWSEHWFDTNQSPLTLQTKATSHKLPQHLSIFTVCQSLVKIDGKRKRSQLLVLKVCAASVLLQCSCSLPFLFLHLSLLTSDWQPSIVHSSNLTRDWLLKLQNYNFWAKITPWPKNKGKILDGRTFSLDCGDPELRSTSRLTIL